MGNIILRSPNFFEGTYEEKDGSFNWQFTLNNLVASGVSESYIDMKREVHRRIASFLTSWE